MSKKWVAILSIASMVGIIAIVSLMTPGPQASVPVNGNRTTTTPNTSPLVEPEEEDTSNGTRTSGSQSIQINMTTTHKENSTNKENTSETVDPLPTLVPEEEETSNGTRTPEESVGQEPFEETARKQITFTTFENSSYGIQMMYPSDWEILDSDDDYDGFVDIAIFRSILENRFDVYRERLRLSLDRLPQENMTLEEYSKDLINFKNNTMEDFDLLGYNTDSNILDGHSAYRLIYTRLIDNDQTIKQMEIGTKIEDKVYFLTYSAEREKYAEYLPIVQDMIDSLEIQRSFE